MNRIVTFVMCDLYNFVALCIVYIVSLYRKVMNIPLPITLQSVCNSKGENITKAYLTSKHWNKNIDSTDVLHFTWTYDNNVYKYACTVDNMIEFPPYTIEQLRNTKPKKIVSISVDNDVQYFETLRAYAGPMHNFYNKCFDVRWVLKKDVTTVSLIDIFGQTKNHGPKIEM